MTNLEKTWCLVQIRGVSQLQQQRRWRASYSNSPAAQFMRKMEQRRKYTVLNWNSLLRSWKVLQRPRLFSTTLNIRCNDYEFNSQRRWCWTMTTLRRGKVVKFVCSWPIPKVSESASIFSATLVTQHKSCGGIYRGLQKTTRKGTLGYTAKGKKSRLSYTI